MKKTFKNTLGKKMKTTTHIRLFFLLFVLATLVSPAGFQVALQLGAGAGLALPMGDYGGQTTDYYAGSKYGLSTGYTVQAKGRVGLAGFTLVRGIAYGHLTTAVKVRQVGERWMSLSRYSRSRPDRSSAFPFQEPR